MPRGSQIKEKLDIELYAVYRTRKRKMRGNSMLLRALIAQNRVEGSLSGDYILLSSSYEYEEGMALACAHLSLFCDNILCTQLVPLERQRRQSEVN